MSANRNDSHMASKEHDMTAAKDMMSAKGQMSAAAAMMGGGMMGGAAGMMGMGGLGMGAASPMAMMSSMPPIPPGPSQGMGLPPNININNVTPEQMIETFQGMIHQALDFLPSDQIQQIVQKNPACINERGFNGIVPLHKAATRGDPSLIEFLLKKGANPNEVNSFNETPLHFAAKVGSPVLMHKLIEAGADINAVEKNGRGVMHLSAQSGSVPAMLYLQEVRGLSAEVCDNNGITPLHLVCAHGHMEALEYLLKKDRVHLTARDVHGNTCLHIASQYCMLEIMWILMERGGLSFLHEQNREGFNAQDLCRNSSAARRKEAEKLLEIYMEQGKTGKITGPTPIWYMLLLFPMVGFWILVAVTQYFTSTKGWVMMAGLLIIMYFIYNNTHRMNHVCRWPNPVHAGMFAAGIFSTMCVYLGQMFIVLQPDMPLLTLLCVFALTLLIFIYYRLLTVDPGLIKENVIRPSTGIPVTIRSVATGEVPVNALCPPCEIVPQMRTHHCRLCRGCYANCDHHCLFLYRCIAQNNHRLFVYFIALTAIAMFVYCYFAWRYFSIVYPEQTYFMDMFGQAFSDSPTAFYLAFANIVSGLWLINLTRYQLVVVGRNHTTAYQPNRGRSALSNKQRYKNMINFLLGKPPHATDDVKKA